VSVPPPALPTDLFSYGLNERVAAALGQLAYLARRYHVVIANPPYMGSGGMNDDLKEFAQANFRDSKSDLFAMFIERNLDLAREKGMVAMITMQSWMFLSSFEAMRARIVQTATILSMAHLGARAFDSIGGEVVSTTAFVLANLHHAEYKGGFVRLVDGRSEAEKAAALLEAIANPACGWFYRAAAADFAKIPGSPIAYWVSEALREAFVRFPDLSRFAETRIGLITGENEHYIRNWHEVSHRGVGFGLSREAAKHSSYRWFPQSKGGDYRKWYGNNETVLDWSRDGHELQYRLHSSGTRTLAHNFNLDKIFLSGITWTKISSGTFAARYQPEGFLFNDASANAFAVNHGLIWPLLGFLCSKLPVSMLQAVNPTLNFLPGNISTLPVASTLLHEQWVKDITEQAVALCKTDWDSYETSWDFTDLPLLRAEFRRATLAETYAALRGHWQAMTDEMQRLEVENNRLFIDAYGLQDELTPDVPLDEITLTCNPHYRYGGKLSDAEREARLLADTLRELISYAVGCLLGRYSLDKPGLILANQGDTVEDYARIVGATSGGGGGTDTIYRVRTDAARILPDADNVIPILDGEWFADDIVARVQRFLRVTFGEERYSENLAFLEQALGRDLRSYFVRDFYADHVQRYQKRPIYWLFSSPKGSFNALIYMHRYRPDTVSVALNDYLREFRAKLSARKAHLQQVSIRASTTARDKTAALKEIDKIDKVIQELTDYENDILYPLATQQIAIDLDDGVKVNYAKFGAALKKIAGL
jgi:type II restriction/modification system DNA methylase subunit YeeA